MDDPTSRNHVRAWEQALADLEPRERQLGIRLLTLLSGATPTALPVIRVERIEVVNRRGRTRVAIGQLGGTEADAVGIGIYDRSGSEGAILAMGEASAWLSFSIDGDDALVLGVHHVDSQNLSPGPHVQLLGPDGKLALAWRVDAESGAVSIDVQESGAGGSDAGTPAI